MAPVEAASDSAETPILEFRTETIILLLLLLLLLLVLLLSGCLS